jgi:hypothetical protein
MDGQLKNLLQRHLKGVASTTFDTIWNKLHLVPRDRLMVVIDITSSLAAISLRAAGDFLTVVGDVVPLLDASALSAWGETSKRLAASNLEAAQSFLQTSAVTLAAIAPGFRLRALTLLARQAAISTNLTLECFAAFPQILQSFTDDSFAARVLNICQEISQYSVKHSYELLKAAPGVLTHLQSFSESAALREQIMELTVAFMHRAGGTAADFFLAIPQTLTSTTEPYWPALINSTSQFLDRSGGVALQYFRAAVQILNLADWPALEKWTQLSNIIINQGNATGYHFLKISPKIFQTLAHNRDLKLRLSIINTVLETALAISSTSPPLAVDCFKSSPVALRQASLEQFRRWAMYGIATYANQPRRAQAYYALESSGSRRQLQEGEDGLRLEQVAATLRLYLEGLTGRPLVIRPVGEVVQGYQLHDGQTVILPPLIADFEEEHHNFKLYKALAAHAAGQIEFGTYQENFAALYAVQTEVMLAFASASPQTAETQTQAPTVNFLSVLQYFPEQETAHRIFTTVENGRIDRHLRQQYRGLRRDLDFIAHLLAAQRPALGQLADSTIIFEVLFQLAICGQVTPTLRQAYASVVSRVEEIFVNYINAHSTVADSLWATLLIYQLISDSQERREVPMQSPQASDTDDSAEMAASGAEDLPDAPDMAAQPLAAAEPFSFWNPLSQQSWDTKPDLFTSASEDTTSMEQALEPGDKVFFYDEWDRDLGDYRPHWCRVIERRSLSSNNGFVESVRARHAGIIAAVRHQFQLLRPESLRRIIGEIDGEDFELQALIDYAIDRRTSGRVSERLYTRKLRRQRDVVVSFLLDMSSSTARMVSRYPNQPYTKPGQRIIDIEKEGLVLMSEALGAIGDGYAINGFTSEGRRNVKFFVIKDFDEQYNTVVEKRINGVNYQSNTRLGAAIRHASWQLMAQTARTKLLIILSDGRPYDHDYGDSRYAREDTKIALRQAKMSEITPFCITIDQESEEQLRELYGEVGYTIIDNVLRLPEKLPGIYRRLTT